MPIFFDFIICSTSILTFFFVFDGHAGASRRSLPFLLPHNSFIAPPSFAHCRISFQKPYVVIGGSGFLGRWVVQELLNRGETNVTIVDKRKTFDEPKAKFIEGSIANELLFVHLDQYFLSLSQET